MPLVQYIILRRELPYKRYLLYLAEYSGAGLLMLLCVRALRPVTPDSWPGLAVQVIAGAAVYGISCLTLWMLTRNVRLLRLIPVIGRRLASVMEKTEGKTHAL